MIKKHHSAHSSTKDVKKTFEINSPAVYFFSLVLLAVFFASGYFYAKTSGASASTQPTAVQPVTSPAQAAQQQAARPQISLDTVKSLFSKNVIKFGSGDKKLLLVEVSDPSCPYCHVAAGVNTEIGAQIGPQFTLKSKGGTYVAPVPEMKKLIDAGKADFVWIYTRGHGNGELATKALYCAQDQAKFWPAHDLLMSAKGYDLLNNQIRADQTKTAEISSFLASAVNSAQLKSCLDSGKYNSVLVDNSALAASLGIQGTPGFYINTTNFAGAYSWTDMQSAADAALK